MSSRPEISEEQRVILDKLKAELPEAVMPVTASGLLGDDKKGKSTQVYVRASMLNNGVATMNYRDHKLWSGSIIGSYPDDIEMNGARSTTHQGVPPKDTEGSMGAIVFVGPNVQDGADDCAWVLAWSVLGDGTTENKVNIPHCTNLYL